ncbi:MAG: hypothetical protein QXH08_00255 [Candidatus Hadarchaeales archaeon]
MIRRELMSGWSLLDDPLFVAPYLIEAFTIASRSSCSSCKVGAVVVNLRERKTIGKGWNQPIGGEEACRLAAGKVSGRRQRTLEPRGGMGVCPRRELGFPSGKGLEICPAIHAETAAILNGLRNGNLGEGKDIFLAVYGKTPCWDCCKLILAVGIRRVVCLSWPEDGKEGIYYNPLSEVFETMGLIEFHRHLEEQVWEAYRVNDLSETCLLSY